MIDAVIKTMGNSLFTEMRYEPYRIADQLRSIGITTPADQLRLNNLNIEIKLIASQEQYQKLIDLFAPDDTLSTVNKVCHTLYCSDWRVETKLNGGLDNGEYKNAQDFLDAARTAKQEIIKNLRNHER